MVQNSPRIDIIERLIVKRELIGIFLAKVCFILFMVIWVRWMWPRFRYDQLMDLGWRRFIPLALANIVITAVVLWAKS